nr:hypothetical protein Iba_chr13fCG0630 [Ipomoea batatas]
MRPNFSIPSLSTIARPFRIIVSARGLVQYGFATICKSCFPFPFPNSFVCWTWTVGGC